MNYKFLKSKSKTYSRSGFTLMNRTSEGVFTLMNRTSEGAFTLMNRTSERAFTLIELLIVISIIGILAALSLASFTTSQKQTRDSQRKSDLSQYRSSLESYANTNNSLYPVAATAISASGSLCTTLGLSNCPEDPKSAISTYKYCSDAAGTDYALWTTLETMSTNKWVVCSDGRSTTSTSTPSCGASFNCNLP